MDPACIGVVEGSIVHTRTRPTHHHFSYRAFCLRIPLQSLPALPRAGIAYNRPGLLSFHDRDHGPRDGSALLPWIRGLLADQGVNAPGPIVLYAFPRMLGYVFNPISFWVCHGHDDTVRAVLCAVSNTFGEHHDYLLAHADGSALRSGQTLRASKVFHVSPFCEVKGQYSFRFSFDPQRWLARIDYQDVVPGPGPVTDAAPGPDREPLLQTRISGGVIALRPDGARRLLWRYGWFTLAVMLRIHWQALLLWRRKVPWFSKPPPPAAQLSQN